MGTWRYKITNKYLTHYSYEDNAALVVNYLTNEGFSIESICGILGNMESESYVNPGQVQNGYSITGISGGWGLIQWTDKTALTNNTYWPGGKWYSGSKQMYVVANEVLDTAYFIPNEVYNYSGEEFKALTDYQEATLAYFYERERGTWSDVRLDYAYHYMELFADYEPSDPSGDTDPTGDLTDPAIGGIIENMRYRFVYQGRR